MLTFWRSAFPAIIVAAAVALGQGGAAAAGDDRLPAQSLVKPVIESQQAAVAPLYGRNYAVVAPIFTGGDGNLSYLRLSNGGSAASTFIVTVVGSPTGKVYGEANVSVPPTASPQYSITDILSRAGAAPLSGGDTAYSLYLQDGDAVGFQHVIYNSTSGFFENASVCQYNMAAASQPVLTNVHTSRLATYPAQISIHNYYNAPVSYRVQVFDSATGVFIGNVPFQTAANSTYLIPESYFEQQLGWTPASNQSHINLRFTAEGIDQAPVIVSNLILSQQLKTYVNMSSACSINDNNGICIRDPNGLTHGCVKGSNLIGGTFGSAIFFSLTVVGGGNGSVDISPQGFSCANGAQCTLLVNAGAEVKLTAVPAAGATFLGWSGACSGLETCSVAMNSNQNLIATFTSAGY